MKIHFQVRHETIYRYLDPVLHSHNEARVLPRTLPWQSVVRKQFAVTPTPEYQRMRTDFFGNKVVHFAIQHPHEQSNSVSEFEVTLHPDQRPDPALSSTEWQPMVSDLCGEARPWTYESPRIPLRSDLGKYARKVFSQHPGLMDACRALLIRMSKDFAFDPQSTLVTTNVGEAFAARRGVCQDFAHIMIGALRAIGIPARYVSGYIETLPPPGQEKLAGADASHAWVSVLDPAIGWVDLDPTNNLLAHDQHVTLGWGRDFSDIPPLKGVVVGGQTQELDVKVDVRRVVAGRKIST